MPVVDESVIDGNLIYELAASDTIPMIIIV